MRTRFKILLAGVIVALAIPSLALAATATDPVVGTWTLNVAKSKFSPGPALKSQRRVYAATAKGIELSWKSIAADGKESSGQSTFRYDGKDYPITGSPNFDTLSLKRLDNLSVESTQKRAGKAVGTSTRVVSADGKTMTLTSKGKSPSGAAYEDVLVFDRS